MEDASPRNKRVCISCRSDHVEASPTWPATPSDMWPVFSKSGVGSDIARARSGRVQRAPDSNTRITCVSDFDKKWAPEWDDASVAPTQPFVHPESPLYRRPRRPLSPSDLGYWVGKLREKGLIKQ